MTGISDFVQQGGNFLARHRKALLIGCPRAGVQGLESQSALTVAEATVTRPSVEAGLGSSSWQIAADRVIDTTLPGEWN